MHLLHPTSPLLALVVLLLPTALTSKSTSTSSSPSGTGSDFALPCYAATLPPLVPSTASRATPWSTAALALPNGTTCCDSLSQVRAGIDAVDEQLIALLALRLGYVREATRFKGNLSAVDVPARDAQVVEGAVEAAGKTVPVGLCFFLFLLC